jgi:TolB-like protein
MSPDLSDDYFAEGLTEELIATVSNIPGLRVIARTPVMRYKGTSKPIAEIGRELHVGSVLEGSVRKPGDKVRISVRLIEAINEEPHWTQKFDREILDIFEIQSEIAGKVAEALQEYVLRKERPVEMVRSTRNPEAYVNYLRGRQYWNKRTEEDLKRAIGFFEAALKIDADYARAFAGLAESYAALALLEFMAPTEAYPKAGEAVRKAYRSIHTWLMRAHHWV